MLAALTTPFRDKGKLLEFAEGIAAEKLPDIAHQHEKAGVPGPHRLHLKIIIIIISYVFMFQDGMTAHFLQDIPAADEVVPVRCKDFERHGVIVRDLAQGLDQHREIEKIPRLQQRPDRLGLDEEAEAHHGNGQPQKMQGRRACRCPCG